MSIQCSRDERFIKKKEILSRRKNEKKLNTDISREIRKSPILSPKLSVFPISFCDIEIIFEILFEKLMDFQPKFVVKIVFMEIFSKFVWM